MPIDTEHYARSLASLKDARALMETARAYVAAWPDLYVLAQQRASSYLQAHTGQALDPDKVWWHAFDTAVSAPTFTGWRHAGPPTQSLTFTQLLVHRFGGGFQEAPDTLALYSGFYTADGNAAEYDQTNEVRLDAQQVLDDFWAMDFAAQVHARTELFWAEEGRTLPLLARAGFIAAIEQGVRESALDEGDRTLLLNWLGLASDHPPTLADLQAISPGTSMSLREYLRAGGGRLLTLMAGDGRIFLYDPASAKPLQAFARRESLQHWLGEQQPLGEGQALSADLFETLAHWAKADLQAQQQALISNADLRKQLWRGYLGAFIQVFGSFATAAWPLSLLLLGAGGARLVLDVDAAWHSRSTDQRRAAIISAVGDALVTVFSIIDIGLGVRALTYREPPHVRLANLEGWQATDELGEDMENLEANRILGLDTCTEGLLSGIKLSDDGATWIEMRERTVRVRYSPDLSEWLVVHDDDPYAFLPTLPVRMEESGLWQLQAPEARLETLTSRFWDVYMHPNEGFAVGLSEDILARQRALLSEADLPRVKDHDDAIVDEQGWTYALRDGKRHYTFEEDGDLHNMLVLNYSMEVAKVNDLFRFGRTDLPTLSREEVHAYLNLLFDSLETLPKSNAMRLWRGGSNLRATGGVRYRTGEVNVGDVLVNTDITSFTENPYVLRMFLTSKTTNAFDETAVVYEWVGEGLRSGIPVAPLSIHPVEAEVLFTPGHYFRIESVREVLGNDYRFIKVRIREVERPTEGTLLDMRTGEPFDRQAYAERVGSEALVERLFPSQPGSQGDEFRS
ncbi:dermonecrotic toxin domain-containing protein [Pseudomonas sp. NPDC008258]|uniref:dermonecrotic toxin domain-containing protein n=1 Tax=Pseudomonas sp. NPDC008258 TaxID=3364418 RepID=UPI0036EF43CC